MATFTTVFLSSTARDLQPYRDAVDEAIRKLDGYHCVRMEDFGARDGTAVEVIRAKVAECDIFVGLIGHLHGSRPQGSVLSFTELEYETAEAELKPRLLFLASEDFPLPPPRFRESDEAFQRQVQFRERVRRERVVDFFEEPQLLATRVVTALQTQMSEEARSAPAKHFDLAQTETLYLEHLAERYRYLDFRGMGVSDRVPLRLPLLEMYVPMKARVETPEGETWARKKRLAGRPVTEEEAEAMGQRLSEPQPVCDLLGRGSGVILLGDPGSGKTTFLKYLALSLTAGQGEALGLGRRIPALVPLSAYANALGDGDLPLAAFLSRYFEERWLDLPLPALLSEKLKRGELLLLLDGLDEVRDLELRHRVVARVEDFYVRYRKAGNKFVLTSRVVGYREVRPVVEGLTEATLIDFDRKEIEAFVDKWTTALEKAAGGDTVIAREMAAREREELLAAVRDNQGVRSLAANPLLLTILALMKRQGVTLPERRVELYQKYVETLLKHWNLARSLAGRPAKDLDLIDTLRVLQPLALWMHETSPGVGLVKEGDLRRELERILGERGEDDPERAAQRFLDDVREHTSLLLDRGGRQYGFIHLTFQEYLAAAALAQKGQQEVEPTVEALAAHVGEDSWHEVSLLTLGYLGLIQQRDQAAGAVLDELLLRAPGEPGEVVVLAGRAVADIGVAGVPFACRERVLEALFTMMRNDKRVPAQSRVTAGAVLATAGDPRLEVMTVDGIELRWIPAGPFLLGVGKGSKKEKPQHQCSLPYDFWMARYPVTVAQFREFITDSRFEPGYQSVVSEQPNKPAIGISWYEAIKFCEWLTEKWQKAGRLKDGWEVRLPSEAEWEKAARGGLVIPLEPVIHVFNEQPRPIRLADNDQPGRRYPWGEQEDPNRANYADTGVESPSAVGCFPSGASPYGCEEMSGNISEWTRSLWGEDWPSPHFGYPYAVEDGRENPGASSKILRVVRGGSFRTALKNVYCAYRSRNNPESRYGTTGFRVMLSLSHSAL
jgi:formylglycine-generating enzyme required for sulfatase activity